MILICTNNTDKTASIKYIKIEDDTDLIVPSSSIIPSMIQINTTVWKKDTPEMKRKKNLNYFKSKKGRIKKREAAKKYCKTDLGQTSTRIGNLKFKLK